MDESIEAMVDRRDMQKLQNLFIAAEKHAVHNVEGMIRQTMGFAVRSAANATKPRSNQNPAGNYRKLKLGNKHLYRPLVAIPKGMGFWYYQKDRYKPFQMPRKVKTKEMNAKKLVRITKAIKMWNRDGGGWKYLPYAGTKRSLKDSRFNIHMAGLAKEGWMRALNGFEKKLSYDNLRHLKNLHGIHTVTQGFLYLSVANKASYVSKSSPNSARYGLKKATNRMRKIYLPKIDRKIQRELNKK